MSIRDRDYMKRRPVDGDEGDGQTESPAPEPAPFNLFAGLPVEPLAKPDASVGGGGAEVQAPLPAAPMRSDKDADEATKSLAPNRRRFPALLIVLITAIVIGVAIMMRLAAKGP
jgi:hypothetical protein